MQIDRQPILVLLAAWFGLFFSIDTLGAPPPAYLWPVKADPAITSSFGEFRPGHFHMGADLKTWGQVGYKIVAIDDGYVSRVRVSPQGYGKAVYLTLTDGKQAIYSHLEGFASHISDIVQIEQERTGRYSIDLWFPPHRFPVKRGEVLGASGRTATSAPHLHFELRDSENQPVNPLTNGFQVADHIRPVITEVLFVPLGPGSRINGASKSIARAARRTGAGVFRIDEPVHVLGSMGLGVRSYDMADTRTNRFEPYSYELHLNNNMIFEAHFELLNYEFNGRIDIATNYRYYKNRRRRFFNLFRLPFNDLTFYSARESDTGIISYFPGTAGSLPKGPQELRLLVKDAQGNMSRLEVPVILNAPPAIGQIKTDRDQAGVDILTSDPDGRVSKVIVYHRPEGKRTRKRWVLEGKRSSSWRFSLEDKPAGGIYYARAFDDLGSGSAPVVIPSRCSGEFPVLEEEKLRFEMTLRDSLLLLEVVSPVPIYQAPVVSLIVGDRRIETILERRDLTTFEAIVDPGPVHDGIEVRLTVNPMGSSAINLTRRLNATLISAEDGGVYSSDDKILSVEFGAGCVYSSLLGRIHPPRDLTADEGLRPVTGAYLVDPGDIPLKHKAKLIFRLPEGERENRRLGVYSWQSKNKWEYEDSSRLDNKEPQITADVSDFSEFVVLEDRSRPSIRNVYPSNGSRIRTLTPRIRFNLSDIGSGIDEDGIELRLNGVKAICEYDPPRNAVYYRVPRQLASGKHRLRIDLSDRAGNKTVWRGTFTATPRSVRR
ncbi:M23 family metallopeptidase [candidate division KSB1 bacterium]